MEKFKTLFRKVPILCVVSFVFVALIVFSACLANKNIFEVGDTVASGPLSFKVVEVDNIDSLSSENNFIFVKLKIKNNSNSEKDFKYSYVNMTKGTAKYKPYNSSLLDKQELTIEPDLSKTITLAFETPNKSYEDEYILHVKGSSNAKTQKIIIKDEVNLDDAEDLINVDDKFINIDEDDIILNTVYSTSGAKDENGDLIKSLSVQSLLGKVTVLTFWYTDCGPCVAQLPDFEEVKESYGDSVNMIVLHSDNGLSSMAVQSFIDADSRTGKTESWSNWQMIFVHDTNDALYIALKGTGGYPKTVIIDANGVITVNWDNALEKSVLIDEIEKAMNK